MSCIIPLFAILMSNYLNSVSFLLLLTYRFSFISSCHAVLCISSCMFCISFIAPISYFLFAITLDPSPVPSASLCFVCFSPFTLASFRLLSSFYLLVSPSCICHFVFPHSISLFTHLFFSCLSLPLSFPLYSSILYSISSACLAYCFFRSTVLACSHFCAPLLSPATSPFPHCRLSPLHVGAAQSSAYLLSSSIIYITPQFILSDTSSLLHILYSIFEFFPAHCLLAISLYRSILLML